MNKKEKQTIKCNVESCTYQDQKHCTLDEICVDNSCNCNDANDKEETICKSFECKEEKGEE